jgi:hypothetical protein
MKSTEKQLFNPYDGLLLALLTKVRGRVFRFRAKPETETLRSHI